jgi:hypothetical protein
MEKHDPDQEIFDHCAFLARTSAPVVSSAWFRQHFCAEAITGLAAEYGIPSKGLEHPSLSLDLFLAYARAQQPKDVRADINNLMSCLEKARTLARGLREAHVDGLQVQCERMEQFADGSANLDMTDPLALVDERIDECQQVLGAAKVRGGRGGRRHHRARPALESLLWELRR